MNIHLDVVTNHSFSSAIQSDLHKLSQEYWALATLRYLFPSQFEKMIKGESPDLQDKINRVGIEVTSAVEEGDMQANRAFAESIENPLSKKAVNDRQAIEKNGYSISSGQFGNVLSAPLRTSKVEKRVFQASIKRKIAKAEKYRSYFSKLGLALMLPEIPTREAENSAIDWAVELLKSDDGFDFIYVISERFCLYYEIATLYRLKYDISKDESHLLRTIARMTAEGELTLDSPVWC